jgi:hypothetical protein
VNIFHVDHRTLRLLLHRAPGFLLLSIIEAYTLPLSFGFPVYHLKSGGGPFVCGGRRLWLSALKRSQYSHNCRFWLDDQPDVV